MQSYFVTIAPFFVLLFDLVTPDRCDQPRIEENHRRRNKCNIIIWRELTCTCTSSDTEFFKWDVLEDRGEFLKV